jgi:subtilisin inhibitor-like
MTSYRLGGALLAAATLLSTVLAGTATATENARPTAHGWSHLILTVEAPHHHHHKAVRLECQPAGGSHPHAKRACLAVAAARGNFDDLRGAQTFVACTMEWRPVVAAARGRWHGHPVYWQHQYPNPCTLLTKTGVVFDF